MIADTKSELITRLQKEILQWEGYKPSAIGTKGTVGLGTIETVFSNKIFPISTIHELICENTEQATAGGGFVSGLLSALMQNGGACLWISINSNVSPIALKTFGIDPERVIFVNLYKEKDVLWVMDEALKCTGLVAVVGEMNEIDFKQSRRLQLAVEQSGVTGFIMRNYSNKLESTACAARWQIKPLPSEPIDGLPGLGFPRWQVELLRVRNGQPGKWVVEWADSKFRVIEKQPLHQQIQKAG